ncbi:hypothetical protein E2542_SST13358 [Spatholobus suberectus]|nr:hypothetical protein E2542_SST13358 [Spatholobus suberectus]
MGDNDGLENVSGSENGSDDGSEATWISAIETMLGAITDKRIKANSISHVPEQLQKSNVKLTSQRWSPWDPYTGELIATCCTWKRSNGNACCLFFFDLKKKNHKDA